MGRELQKKKNRSSIPKVKQKPKSKKVNVRGNPVVAANWDKTQTLRQNYKRLGLSSRLNAVTGGIEKTSTDVGPPKNDPFAITSNVSKRLYPSEARVERDESGKIIRIIREDDEKSTNPLGDPLNDIEAMAAGNIAQHNTTSQYQAAQTDVVAKLEAQARDVAPKEPRKPSARESEWAARLVEKYDEDYSRMAMDRRLNPMQQSAGDIRRRIMRWKSATA